ncbi:unnamed protein product [Pleuronectes platessa]|uniref:Uncharacterized protein n=1 Tax=Pleuronectes platessa TaxID=8262 RepID=A0A9N7Z805_PLEPL|nr:unnamed protein product [Pleuronectes platessa]
MSGWKLLSRPVCVLLQLNPIISSVRGFQPGVRGPLVVRDGIAGDVDVRPSQRLIVFILFAASLRAYFKIALHRNTAFAGGCDRVRQEEEKKEEKKCLTGQIVVFTSSRSGIFTGSNGQSGAECRDVLVNGLLVTGFHLPSVLLFPLELRLQRPTLESHPAEDQDALRPKLEPVLVEKPVHSTEQ